MRPTRTDYRLVTPEDEAVLTTWLTNKMGTRPYIGWPSLIAIRGGLIRGAIVTQKRDDFVVCGPVYSDYGVVAVRLFTLYENLLVKLGIKEYWFSVEDRSSRLMRLLRRKEVELTERGSQGGLHWYKRRIAV